MTNTKERIEATHVELNAYLDDCDKYNWRPNWEGFVAWQKQVEQGYRKLWERRGAT